MKKIGVIFGGISTEHDVSIVSGTSVIKNLNKNKYEITPIYISKEGEWYKFTEKDTAGYVHKTLINLIGEDNRTK